MLPFESVTLTYTACDPSESVPRSQVNVSVVSSNAPSSAVQLVKDPESSLNSTFETVPVSSVAVPVRMGLFVGEVKVFRVIVGEVMSTVIGKLS